MGYHIFVDAAKTKLATYVQLSEEQVLELVKYTGSGSIQLKKSETDPEQQEAEVASGLGEVRSRFSALGQNQAEQIEHTQAHDELFAVVRALKLEVRINYNASQEPLAVLLGKILADETFRKKFELPSLPASDDGSSTASVRGAPESIASIDEERYQELVEIVEVYETAQTPMTWEALEHDINEAHPLLPEEDRIHLETELRECVALMQSQFVLPASESQLGQTQIPSGMSWNSLMDLDAKAFEAELKLIWKDLPSEKRLSSLKKVLALWAMRQLEKIEALTSEMRGLSPAALEKVVKDAFEKLFDSVIHIDQELCSMGEKSPASLNLLARRLKQVSGRYIEFLHGRSLEQLQLYNDSREDFRLMPIASPDSRSSDVAHNVWRLLADKMLNYSCDNLFTAAETLLPDGSLVGSALNTTLGGARAGFQMLYHAIANWSDDEMASTTDSAEASPHMVGKNKLKLTAGILLEHWSYLHSKDGRAWEMTWEAFHTQVDQALTRTESSGDSRYNGLRLLRHSASVLAHFALKTPIASWGERLQKSYREFIEAFYNEPRCACPKGPGYHWKPMFEGFTDVSKAAEDGAEVVLTRQTGKRV